MCRDILGRAAAPGRAVDANRFGAQKGAVGRRRPSRNKRRDRRNSRSLSSWDKRFVVSFSPAPPVRRFFTPFLSLANERVASFSFSLFFFSSFPRALSLVLRARRLMQIRKGCRRGARYTLNITRLLYNANVRHARARTRKEEKNKCYPLSPFLSLSI